MLPDGMSETMAEQCFRAGSLEESNLFKTHLGIAIFPCTILCTIDLWMFACQSDSPRGHLHCIKSTCTCTTAPKMLGRAALPGHSQRAVEVRWWDAASSSMCGTGNWLPDDIISAEILCLADQTPISIMLIDRTSPSRKSRRTQRPCTNTICLMCLLNHSHCPVVLLQLMPIGTAWRSKSLVLCG